ncbi:hypothetical protein D3C80_1665990 [compost metagenome]
MLERVTQLADVVGADRTVAEGELPGSTMGHDLNRVDLAQLRQCGADRGQAVLTAVDDDGRDVARQVA